MFTKEEIALAKPVYEAIPKIAERTEKKCPNCKGLKWRTQGMIEPMVGAGKRVPCHICNGVGKVKGKWEWEPEMGEWVLWKNKPYVIYEVEENLGVDIGYKDIRIAAPYDFHYVMRKTLIPLLHWERIEGILEGMGGDINFQRGVDWCCWLAMRNSRFIQKDGEYLEIRAKGKTRQEAVMRAVIELRKESSNEKD